MSLCLSPRLSCAFLISQCRSLCPSVCLSVRLSIHLSGHLFNLLYIVVMVFPFNRLIGFVVVQRTVGGRWCSWVRMASRDPRSTFPEEDTSSLSCPAWRTAFFRTDSSILRSGRREARVSSGFLFNNFIFLASAYEAGRVVTGLFHCLIIPLIA